MTTLREILDDDHTKCCSSAAAYRMLRARIESWAYGEEKECQRCDGSGWQLSQVRQSRPLCPSCHGTGKTREPGLVERMAGAGVSVEDAPDGRFLRVTESSAAFIAALLQELGEVLGFEDALSAQARSTPVSLEDWYDDESLSTPDKGGEMRGPGGYGRYNDDPEHVGCPRAKTDMTPCVARDGQVAVADDGVCVGCGASPGDLLRDLVREVTAVEGES